MGKTKEEILEQIKWLTLACQKLKSNITEGAEQYSKNSGIDTESTIETWLNIVPATNAYLLELGLKIQDYPEQQISINMFHVPACTHSLMSLDSGSEKFHRSFVRLKTRGGR